MNPFKEVSEIINLETKEIGNTTKAFENTNTAGEVKEPRHITTINESLEGKKHFDTNVEYKRHEFKLNGEWVEGVFPKFESRFDTYLSKNLWNASDVDQFKYCTEKLRQRIGHNPEFASQFTSRQLEQIKDGAPRISGLTWHHNEIPGKMQLVSSEVHDKSGHTGGRNIWGGGSGCR